MALPVFHVWDRLMAQLQEHQMREGEVPTQRQEEWRKKMENLHDQHKRETVEQHKQHLEQLQVLQNQLLQEISFNMEHQLAKTDLLKLKQLKQSKSADLYISGKVCLSPGKVCQSPKHQDFSLGQYTPQQSAHMLTTTKDLVSVSSHDTTTKHMMKSTSKTPGETWGEEHRETSQLRVTKAEAHHRYEASRSAQPYVLSRSPPSEYGDDDRSPRAGASGPGTPHVHSHSGYGFDTFMKLDNSAQQLGKRIFSPIKGEYDVTPSNTSLHSHTSQNPYETSPQNHTHIHSHNLVSNSARALFQTSAASQSYDRRLSRQLLLEKHAKHIEDLKKYYGAEIAMLSEKLSDMEKELNKSPPARRNLNFDELQGSTAMRCCRCGASGELWDEGGGGAREAATLAELQALNSENLRLEEECSRLKKGLKEKTKQCDGLKDQQKQAEKHVLEWQEHCTSSEKLIAMLKERLEGIRKEVQGQDSMRGEMQADLQAAREDLRSFKLQNKQDRIKMNELFRNFEELQVENLKLREVNKKNEVDLKAGMTEVVALRASIGNYKVIESKYKSSIHGLEDEVRHLEHIKNRMHNMETHYELGYSKVSPAHVEPRRRTTPPSAQSKVHSHRPPPKESPSQPPASHTHKPVAQEMTATPEKQLTKKKWLETSDPALFGTTPTNYGKEDEAKKPSRDSPAVRGRDTSTRIIRDRAELNISMKQLDHVAGSAMKAIKEGKIVSQEYFHQHKKIQAKVESSAMDHEKTRCMEVCADAEERLERLVAEKEMLESSLQRASRVGVKSSREIKQNRFDMEDRLEDVMQEIGSARLILKQHHVLGIKS